MKRWLPFACALFVAPQPVVFAKAKAQDWIPLQDGRSLAGWKAPERPESWKVEDGVFVTRGDRSHLYYVGKVGPRNHPGDIRNFEFSAEVLTEPGSNSGIYVHTKYQPEGWPAAGYEIQVINSNPPAERMNGYVEHKMTGSIYAVRNTWVAPAKDNEWFNYRIRVVGKTIQTFIDDKLICEYAESEHPWRAKDKQGRLLSSGTFALQAHDPGSVVKYRNMKVKILPNDAMPPAGLVPLADPELDELISWASDVNIPLIDGGLMEPPDGAEQFWSDMRRHGVTPGSSFSSTMSDHPPKYVLLILDGEKGPDVDVLKAAKSAGLKVTFASTAGSAGVDEAQLKRRLLAIKEAGLGWKDFMVPGK
jgi:hypothetical protein